MARWVSELEDLLKLPSSQGDFCSDTAVLDCGCLVSEASFREQRNQTCPVCSATQVSLLREVAPMRELYRIVQDLKAAETASQAIVDNESVTDLPDLQARNRLVRQATRRGSRSSATSDKCNLMSLFYKYAKEEEENHAQTAVASIEETRSELKVMGVSQSETHPAIQEQSEENIFPETSIDRSKILDEDKERNFSQCFPFHRKVSTYNTQPKKFLFDKGFKLKRFVCSAITRRIDSQNNERVVFCLVSEKRWELYVYTVSRPMLMACGKSTGEYGPQENEVRLPSSHGHVVRSDFPYVKAPSDQTDVASRLKSSIHLSCALTDKYLALSGTGGVLRVLNVDHRRGEIGAPVYTYLTNFPIRCIALAPNSNILACGITTREKVSGKQQPFIILHHLERTSDSAAVQVNPITITVPFRDPLKLLTFNATSTHLLCCTIYEMRYFLISLRNRGSKSYKEPRLVFSDTRAPKNYKDKFGINELDKSSGESNDEVEDFMGIEDDDHMLDNEGITDIKFGTPFSNTIVMTSSSLKKRTSIVLKINGYAVDSREVQQPGSEDLQLYSEVANSLTQADYYEDTSNAEIEVLMKVPEIGSNIYRVETSPRGNGMVFVDKSGRLLLVSTPNAQMNFVSNPPTRKSVVLLGEVAPALRAAESASVCFSFDGGKVYAVDRKGVFQVFDFTKGLPGVDSEVLKCKIISI